MSKKWTASRAIWYIGLALLVTLLVLLVVFGNRDSWDDGDDPWISPEMAT